MNVTTFYVPSDRMNEQYGPRSKKHAQDRVVVTKDRDQIAIIDAASNFLGRPSFTESRAAAQLGIPSNQEVNGGVIASWELAESIHRYQGHPDLMVYLNQVLNDCCQQLGINVDPSRRGELLTGYVAHLAITDQTISVTAVGDCYVAINGKTVVGVEKAIDAYASQLIDRIAAEMEIERQSAYEMVMKGPMSLNAQQFSFQNEPESGKFWYPALDGTTTPPQGVEHAEFDRSTVKTIVMWTDGYKPRGAEVFSLEDLEATNPKFSERAAIVITEV